MDAQVDAGALAGFQDFFLQLLLHFGYHFLDAGGMDAAVHYQLVQGQAGHLAADRVEGAQQDGIRGIVHYNLYAGRGLQGADVAAFTADDAAFNLVTLNGEGGDGVLDGRFRCGALDGVNHNALGFLGGVQAGFVDGIVDIGLGLGAGFRLHAFHELVLGILGAHAGHRLNLADDLAAELLVFRLAFFHLIFLGLGTGLLGLQLLVFAVHLVQFLVQAVFLLPDAVFRFTELGVLLVHRFLVLALEREILFLGLENALVLDFLAFQFCLFQDFIALPLEDRATDEYVCCQGDNGPGDKSDK